VGKRLDEVRLRGVHPQFVLMTAAWGVQLPFDILITSGVRTNAEQMALYAQGRTKPGPIVTQASSAAYSAHGRRWFNGMAYGCAVDAVPCTGSAGQPNYGDVGGYEVMAIIAERMQLTWGGRWVKFTDKPHFQLLAWKDWPAAPDDAPSPDEGNRRNTDFSDVEGGSS
jgi:peptidoglycan L-alanyl-D-glutamate endopeptidase CwlK